MSVRRDGTKQTADRVDDDWFDNQTIQEHYHYLSRIWGIDNYPMGFGYVDGSTDPSRLGRNDGPLIAKG